MSTVPDTATELASTLRSDLEAAREMNHAPAIAHSLRFVLENVVIFGLVLRHLCYFGVAVAAETWRRGTEPVFRPDEDSPGVNWNYLAPGFEHRRQSRWEIRLAGFYTLVVGFIGYQTIAPFPMPAHTRMLVIANFGVMFLDPAWTEVYLAFKSRGSDSESNTK
jgi:hypothetical protein